MQLEELIADAAWLQRLAVALAGDKDDAADLVQETRIAAWRRAPETDRPLRPWLAKVMRDLSRMGRRSSGRRRLREEAIEAPEEAATSDELLDQLRLHRRLAELVLALDEPQRSTVVARFFEGRSCAAIARRLGIPESTVRTRLRDGLARLRDQLEPKRRMRAVLLGGLAMGGKGKAAIAVGGLIALLALVLLGSNFHSDGSTAVPVASHRDTDARVRPLAESHDVKLPSWLAVIPGHPHAIAGVVVDAARRPIQGARVELQGWSALDAGGIEARTTSGNDGSFTFTPRASWSYTVVASADGFASSAREVDPRTPPVDRAVLVLSRCDATVEGKITDLRGGVVAGAVIQDLLGGMGPFGARATSGADGRYALCVAPGEHRIAFGSDGYETTWQVVQAGGHQQVDVVLAVESSLSGRLLDEVDGRPIAGAQVALWPWRWASGGAAHRAVLTDEQGNFEVRGLGAGRFELKVWDSTHISTQVEQVTIEPEQANGPIELRLPRGVAVSGTVRSAGHPLVGTLVAVSVPALPGVPRSHWTVTGPDGVFQIRDAPASANARIEVKGYDAAMVVDTSHGALVDVQVDADPRPVVRGVVICRGSPVANASVDAGGNDRATTDGAGRFALVVKPGSYQLDAHSDALGARMAAALPVSAPGADVVLDLNADAEIAGTVVDTTGALVSGATIVATGEAEQRTARTDVSGAFALRGLAGRPVTLVVEDRAWAGDAPRAIAFADPHARVDGVRLVVERPRTTLRGHVVDDRGAPVADAAVGVSSNVVVTDEIGSFSLEVVGRGPFTVIAAKGAGLWGELDKAAPDANGLVVALHRLGSLRGTIIGLPRAHVWIRRARDGYPAYSPRVTNDAFVVEAIDPGTYLVTGVDDDGQKASATVTVEDGASTSVTLAAAREN